MCGSHWSTPPTLPPLPSLSPSDPLLSPHGFPSAAWPGAAPLGSSSAAGLWLTPTAPLPAVAPTPTHTPLDEILACTTSALAAAFSTEAAAAAAVAAATPLAGSSVARSRCLQALALAAHRLTPRMGLRGLVTALQLLGHLGAGAATATNAPARPQGACEASLKAAPGMSATDVAAVVRQLAEPFLLACVEAAAAAAADAAADPRDLIALVAALPALHPTLLAAQSHPGTPGAAAAGAAGALVDERPATHAALRAALASLGVRGRAFMPSPQELCVCAAAAGRCGCPPPEPWLALLWDELRNQMFLVTPAQGAVVLASLESLAALPAVGAAAAAAAGSATGGGAGLPVGQLPLLPPESVAMLWAEVRGKAAAATAGAGAVNFQSCAEVLLELAAYSEAGLLPAAPRAQAREPPGGPANAGAAQERAWPAHGQVPGHGRVRYLVATQLESLAPQLRSCSAAELALVLPAIARLAPCVYWPAAPLPDEEAAPEDVGLAAEGQELTPPLGACDRVAQEATDALLRAVRAGSLGWPQLAACVCALATLTSAAAGPSGTAAAAARGAAGPALGSASRPVPSPTLGPAAAPMVAALRELLAEVPDALERCLLAAASDAGAAPRRVQDAGGAGAAAGGGAALGPAALAWLPAVQAALLQLRQHASLPQGAADPVGRTEERAPLNRSHQGADDGLARRALARVLDGLGGLRPAALLQLAAAAQYPWTAALFSAPARRDVALAVLAAPLPSGAVGRGRGNLQGAAGGEAADAAAVAAALLPGIVACLDAPATVAVLAAAAQRQMRLGELGRPNTRRRRRAPPDPVAAAALSAGLTRLLALTLPEQQPGFMDWGTCEPGRPVPARGAGAWVSAARTADAHGVQAAAAAAAAALTGGRWCEALRSLSVGLDALHSTSGGPLGPRALKRLLHALEPVWAGLTPGQTADLLSELAGLLERCTALQEERGLWGPAYGAGRQREGGPPGWRQADGSGGEGGSGPSAEEWQRTQRAAAAAMYGMAPAALAATVSATAALAAATGVPVCGEWSAALAEVLSTEPRATATPPSPLAGGLDALDAATALELLVGCVELKAAVTNPDAGDVPLLTLLQAVGKKLASAGGAGGSRGTRPPWDPQLLQRLQERLMRGASLRPAPPAALRSRKSQGGAQADAPAAAPGAVLCWLLLRLSALASSPQHAVALGAAATPLLAFLQQRSFQGADLRDRLALLQGLAGLLLRPNDPWVGALCDATPPALLAGGDTSLGELAALSYGMARAWLVPPAGWHAALEEATLERLRLLGGLDDGGAEALEQLLWAQALWCRLSAGGEGRGGEEAPGGGGGRRPSGAWLGALGAAAVPLLPDAPPRVLAGMAYSLALLGHDPGPDFIAGLLRGCTVRLRDFEGPQLSRLAYGLAGMGYQPEDPWVAALQEEAARKLGGCDSHELADLLEGVLLLAEGCEAGIAGGGGNGGDRRPGGRGVGSGLAAGGAHRSCSDPRVSQLLLDAMWQATAAHMAAEADTMSLAVERRDRRAELQAVQALKADFRAVTDDPRIGPFWRYWTEQLPALDPGLIAPDAEVEAELAQLSAPLPLPRLDADRGPAAATSDPQAALRRLHRFLSWAALRDGGLPGPLPEAAPPWCGALAVRCVEVLGGARAGRVQGVGAAAEVVPAALAASGSATATVVVAPPPEWLAALVRCQAAAMRLGWAGLAARPQLLAAGRAVLAWDPPPSPEWREAFLRASCQAFFPPSSGSANRGSGGSDGGPGSSRQPDAWRAAQPGGLHNGGAVAAALADERERNGQRQAVGGTSMEELLQLLAVAVSLDLAPGPDWLAGAEAASLPLFRSCRAEEGVALLLAAQRLQHQPGREWSRTLLRAVLQPALAARALPAVGVAALLTALADVRVRPADGWVDCALAALHGRHGEVPAPLLTRMLSALAALEVQPTGEWLSPWVDAFWASLPELLPPSAAGASHSSSEATDVVVLGLSGLSDLGVAVKQGQLRALLELLAARLAASAAGPGAERGTGGEALAAAAVLGAAPLAAASGVAAEIARVLICLAEMRRATPDRANRRSLDLLFRAVAERLPVSGPLTPKLLDSWDKLVPM